MFTRFLTRTDKVIFALVLLLHVTASEGGRRPRGRRPAYVGYNSDRRHRHHEGPKSSAVPSLRHVNVTSGNANQVPSLASPVKAVRIKEALMIFPLS